MILFEWDGEWNAHDDGSVCGVCEGGLDGDLPRREEEEKKSWDDNSPMYGWLQRGC